MNMAYLLAFIISAAVGWSYTNKILTVPVSEHAGNPRTRYPSKFAKYIPGGMMFMLTSLGAVALGRWGVKELGPELGVFWVLGCLLSSSARYTLIVRDITHSSIPRLNLSRNELKQIAACARQHLLTDGLSRAKREVPKYATKLVKNEDTRRELENKKSEIIRLEKTTKQADLRITKLANELNEANLRLSLQKAHVQLLVELFSLASVCDYRGWDKLSLLSFLQTLANRLAKLLGEEHFGVSIYFAPTDETKVEIGPQICSRRKDNIEKNTPYSAVSEQDVLHIKYSLLGYCLTMGAVVTYPREAEQIKLKLGKSFDDAAPGWLTGVAIPIPPSDPDTAPEARRNPHGAIIVRCLDATQVQPDALPLLLGASSLIDLVIQLAKIGNSTELASK